jgi:outer membrane protein
VTRTGLWLLVVLLAATSAFAQNAPPAFNRPWNGAGDLRPLVANDDRDATFGIDPRKTYSLAELIDLAQSHNPETRFAWQQARARAAALGVARSELYPTLAAAVLGKVDRADILSASTFIHQTLWTSAVAFEVSYLIVDAGWRAGRIDAARAALIAADFSFNDAHRALIHQVAVAYYEVLNASGQEEAAQASLANAQAVQRSAEDRLNNGLATLPDVLEARSATAQADYELQAVLGAEEIARGNLATALGLLPATVIPIEPITEIAAPEAIGGTVEEAIERGLAQRPDLRAQAAQVQSADARARTARAALYPALRFNAQPTPQWMQGLQRPFAWAPSQGVFGAAAVTLDWTIFDGGARTRALAEARADAAAAQARLAGMRDQVANLVWNAYSRFKTALRQRNAALALLRSATESYAAALESYNLGLRSLLDLTAAQRTLAQARSTDVLSRAQVLTALADLAFQTADSMPSAGTVRP